MTNSSALVLFSGGQDSTISLIWACKNFKKVETIGFHYNQRHVVEMKCRTNVISRIKKDMGLDKIIGKDHVLDLSVLGSLSESALTNNSDIKTSKNGLPNTFVPARNLVFFTMSASLAYKRNITNIVGGMCETDYSGYPDCRQSTINAQQEAISLGLDRDIIIHTPLMHMSKSKSWHFANQIGGQLLTEIIIKETHTCYLGERNILYEWGYGCSECPACELRKKGFSEWKKNYGNI